MIKLFYGNEPYYLDSEKNKVLRDVGELDASVFTKQEDALEMAYVPPFFSDCRIVLLEIEKLGADEKLFHYLESPAPATDFYIFAKCVDKNTKVYKKIKKSYEEMVCDKLADKALRKWTMKQLSENRACIRDDAYPLFVQRICYWDDSECSLYTIKTLLFQMASYNDCITIDVVKDFVPETLNEKIFALSGYLLKCDFGPVFRLSQALLNEKEQPIAMLSVLLRTFRLAYKASVFADVQGKELSSMLGAPCYQYAEAMKYAPGIIKECMDELQDAVNSIKVGNPGANVFMITLGSICTKLSR